MKKPVVGSAGFCGGRWGGSTVISIYFKTDVQQAAGLFFFFEPVGLFSDKVMWLLLPPSPPLFQAEWLFRRRQQSEILRLVKTDHKQLIV